MPWARGVQRADVVGRARQTARARRRRSARRPLRLLADGEGLADVERRVRPAARHVQDVARRLEAAPSEDRRPVPDRREGVDGPLFIDRGARRAQEPALAAGDEAEPRLAVGAAAAGPTARARG